MEWWECDSRRGAWASATRALVGVRHGYASRRTCHNSLKGVDLLVCEGTYGSDEDLPKAVRNRHMTFREAAALGMPAPTASGSRTSARRSKTRVVMRRTHGVFPQARIGHDGSDDRPFFSRRLTN